MLTLEEYEKLHPRCEIVHDGVRVIYATPPSITQWRVDTLFEKEPITEGSVRRDLLLFDIYVRNPPEAAREKKDREAQPTAAKPAVNFSF